MRKTRVAMLVVNALAASYSPRVAAQVAGVTPASSPGDLSVSTANRCAWPTGEPLEDREALNALSSEGSALLHESLYVRAAEKFREALRHCEHPGVHFNLALALINLGRPLEVRDHLEIATSHGPDPLAGKERLEHAQNYLKLLEGQLVKVKVRCDVPGAKVTMDGEELFTPPGEIERWAKAGRHFIVATKDGYVANEVSRTLDSGARPVYDLKLNTQQELTEYRRRWSQAVPWSVIGAGAAVSLAGGGMLAAARIKANNADSVVRDQCMAGCMSPPSGDKTKRTQSARLQKAAYAAFAVGGAAIVTGGVLAFLNRAQAVVRRYEPDATPVSTPRVGLVPYLDTNTQGVVALGTF